MGSRDSSTQVSWIFRLSGKIKPPVSPSRHPRLSWPQPSILASELPPQNHEVEFGLIHKAHSFPEKHVLHSSLPWQKPRNDIAAQHPRGRRYFSGTIAKPRPLAGRLHWAGHSHGCLLYQSGRGFDAIEVEIDSEIFIRCVVLDIVLAVRDPKARKSHDIREDIGGKGPSR